MRFKILIIFIFGFSKLSFGQAYLYAYQLDLELPDNEVVFPKFPKKFDGFYYYSDTSTIFKYDIKPLTVEETFKPSFFTNIKVIQTRNYTIAINYKKPCFLFVRVVGYHKKENKLILGFNPIRDSVTNKYFSANEQKFCFYNFLITSKKDKSTMSIDFFIKSNKLGGRNTFKFNYIKGVKVDYGLLKK